MEVKCKNCGKSITINEDKSDWYKRNMLKTKGYTFCSNKCSIQYNHLQKFFEKYDPIIIDIKYLYEETSIPIKDIMNKYNLNQSTWNKIVSRYDLKRSDNLKHDMYSSKNKQQYKNLSNQSKEKWKHKLSNSGMKYWKSLNRSDRIIRNAKNDINNKSKSEQINIKNKAHLTKKLNNSYGKSNLEDDLYNYLAKEFGESNIKRQYIIDNYSFDFAITRYDTKTNTTFLQLVEINGSYYHNFRPFIECKEHIEEYNKMQNIGGQKARIADTWRYRDIAKYNFCKYNNYNLTVLYIDNNPKSYFTIEQLKESYIKIKKQKLDYTNISKYDEIIDYFCYQEIYKNNLERLKNKETFYKYLVNRIKYAYNQGKGCHIITSLKLLKDFNKCSNMLSSYTMHPIVNIQKFIRDYNITTIADMFAGWGHRLLGALASNINYIGCDINDIQYNNLQNIKDFIYSNFNQNNICQLFNNDSYNVDVSKLSYDGIFICPPYYNLEIYTDKGIENLNYEEYKQRLKEIILKWNKPSVKAIAIQFTDRFEDCINNIGIPYTKIPITKSKYHLNSSNKYKEYIYILKE